MPRMHHLAFFGNLVPCFADQAGLDVLEKLLEEAVLLLGQLLLL